MPKEIDFGKAYIQGYNMGGQDLSANSFSDLLNTISSKTGQKATFTFSKESQEEFKKLYGEDNLNKAKNLMSDSLVINNSVNSTAGFFTPGSTNKQAYDPEFALFFPQAKMSSQYEFKKPSIEFEWNGNITPVRKLTTEQVADVNSVYFDSKNNEFKPLNKSVIDNWEGDNWSLDNITTEGDLQEFFGFSGKDTERVTLMRNQDIAKLNTEEGIKTAKAIQLGQLNPKDIYRLYDESKQEYLPVWRTVTEQEDPFDLNNIRSIWGPKTIQNNNIALEVTESFNDAFMSALDGVYFTTYAARKMTSPFTSPYLKDSDFNNQLENEYNRYQQWSQGRRSTAAEEEEEAWYKNMTNLTKGVANGVGQLIATAGVGSLGKLGVTGLSKLALSNTGKVLGGSLVREGLAQMPANIARGFSAAYAMSSAQQEARRAGLDENESLVMGGLAGAALQLTEKMIGGNESWFYKAFVPKEVSSKAGKFIVERVKAEAQLAGLSIKETMQNSTLRSNIMKQVTQFFTEETDNFLKAGVQSFGQEAVQEFSEDAINKFSQFGFNTVADGLKASGYDWIADESRYKVNLRETLGELTASFFIGGLTGGVTGSSMSLMSSKKNPEQEIDGAKMNSLVHYYVDNRGDVSDYYAQLEELRKNEWTGNPYVTSSIKSESKSRRLADRLTFGLLQDQDQKQEMTHTNYMYDLMKTEADFIFNRAESIRQEYERAGLNPYADAQAFGEEISKKLALEPKQAPDVITIDKNGKIHTLAADTYKEAVKDLSPEEIEKNNFQFLNEKEGIGLKKDLLVRDIQSSIFLEGMNVFHKENEVSNKLALQLAKRNSRSLFSNIDHKDIKAFNGNYKGRSIDGEYSYDPNYDAEFSDNFNLLKHKDVIEVKSKIRKQNDLAAETRQLQTQINEIENKADRYGYSEVKEEVIKELKEQIKERNTEISELNNEIETSLTQTLGLAVGREINAFVTDLRSLVEYEQYSNNITDRVNYYKRKANFNRIYNDSTFSNELQRLLKGGGWSPYDYEDEINRLKQSKEVFTKLGRLSNIKKAEILKQLTVDSKEFNNLDVVQSFSEAIKTNDISFLSEEERRDLLLEPLTEIDPTALVNTKYNLDISNTDNDLRQISSPNAEDNLKYNLKALEKDLNKINEATEEELKIYNAFINDFSQVSKLSDEAKKTKLYSDLLEEMNEEGEVGLMARAKDLLVKRLEDSEYSLEENYIENLIRGIRERFYLTKDIVSNIEKVSTVEYKETISPSNPNFDKLLLQDTGESVIIDESRKALNKITDPEEIEDPKFYKKKVNEINSILPRLYYIEQDLLSDPLRLKIYNYLVAPESIPAQEIDSIKDNIDDLVNKSKSLLLEALLVKNRLEKRARDLEEAVSKRYIQDIDYKRAYIEQNKKTLLSFLGNVLKKKKSSILESLHDELNNLTVPTKVPPTGDPADLNNYVQSTIDTLPKLLELEQKASKELSALKGSFDVILESLFEDKQDTDIALISRRFDSKGLKYSYNELSESAKLERDINYLLLLNRGFAGFYTNIKKYIKSTDDQFILNFPQFQSLRQIYSFANSNNNSELTKNIAEKVTKAIENAQEELGYEYIISGEKVTGDSVLKWASNQISVRGLPGVGKTEYLINYFIKILYNKPSAKILVTAPEEEQFKTIKNSVEKIEKGNKTIDYVSYDRLRNMKTSEINDYDFIIIDESSLLPRSNFLKKLPDKLKKAKVIFSGDELQENKDGIYALYNGEESDFSKLEDESRTDIIIDYIMERTETLDTVVRTGIVDIAKYIEAVAGYIPEVNTRLVRTTVPDNKIDEVIQDLTEVVNEKKSKIDEESFYYEEDYIVKNGLKITKNQEEFISNIAARYNQNPEGFKVIVPTANSKDNREVKKFLKQLAVAGVPVGKLGETVDRDKNIVITSLASQGKTIKDVFLYIPPNQESDLDLFYRTLSGVFVGASRASQSLVVYQDDFVSSLLPFKSTSVSTIDKILTYPPFVNEDETVSSDTEKRQENFREFVNKLPDSGVTQNQAPQQDTAEEESEDTSKYDAPESAEGDIGGDPLGEFYSMFNDVNIKSYGDLKTAYEQTIIKVEEKGDLSELDILKETINNKLNNFDRDLSSLEADDIKVLLSGITLILNNTNIANAELKTLMENKKTQIDDYNKTISTMSDNEVKQTQDDISKNSKVKKKDRKSWNKREIVVESVDNTDEDIKNSQIGFTIQIKKEKDKNNILIKMVDSFTTKVGETSQGLSRTEKADLLLKLKQLAYYSAKYGVNYTGDNKETLKRFLEETKSVNGPDWDNIDPNNINLNDIKDVLLIPIADSTTDVLERDQLAARNNNPLFREDLDLDNVNHRMFIVQMILLSKSPVGRVFGLTPTIISSKISEGDTEQDINSIQLIEPLMSAQKTTQPVKKPDNYATTDVKDNVQSKLTEAQDLLSKDGENKIIKAAASMSDRSAYLNSLRTKTQC